MPPLTRLLPLVLVLPLALGGCGGGGETRTTEAATQPPPTAEERPSETEGEHEGDARPGVVLEEFVAAARAEDFERMWGLLSEPTRERLGPTAVRFESGAGAGLRRDLSRFNSARSDVFLDETITAAFAVAAVGGRVGAGGNGPFAVYAAALRREPAGWRLELGGPVELRPVAPDPGSTVKQRVRVAAEIRSDDRVAEAGLWVDGRSVPGRLALTGPRGATMFSEDAPPLVAGPHAVVAFASTFAEASAAGWVFARGRG